MRRRFHGFIRLTRFQEYVWFVLVTTLLGAAVGRGAFGWPLLMVVAANWLAVGFAFMINDVEDAPDDALNPAKLGRNPVSAGHLPAGWARALSFLTAALAAVLYASLGLWPLVSGLICLALAYLYSARGVRLKAIPIADLVSHALMLAGLQFLTGYLTFAGGTAWEWVYPVSFVMAISLYGQLFNELRDLEGDRRAGVVHTAGLLGPRVAYLLMMAWFAVGVLSAGATVFVIRLIPNWVLLVICGVAASLLWRPLLRLSVDQSAIELQQSFQKPIEVAVALGLATWFAGPWGLAVFR
ncbi:MAG: UbiA prenyltransferase family protein [Anaerolineales bacterium]